jgi:hypothetical protein
MDDFNICSSSIEDLEKVLNLTNEFNSLHNLKSNPKKSFILSSNFPLSEINCFINGEKIPVIPSSSTVRFLGGFYSMNFSGNESARVVDQFFSDSIKLMTQRRIPVRQAVYIFNSVLLPSALYRFKTAFPHPSILSRLDIKIKKFI